MSGQRTPSLARASIAGVVFTLLALLPSAVLAQADPSIAEVRKLRKAQQYEEADALAEDLLDQAEREHGSDSPEVATVLDALVEAWMADQHIGTPSIIEMGERAVSIRERLEPGDSDHGMSLHRLAFACSTGGQPGRAVELQLRAVEIYRDHPGPENRILAFGLVMLGRSYHRNDQWPEAIAAFEEAIPLFEELGPRYTPMLAECYEQIALATPAGDPRRMGLVERAVALRETKPDRPFGLALGLYAKATVLLDSGHLVEGLRLSEEVLRLIEENFAPDDYRVSVAADAVALALYRAGFLAEARPLLERAVSIKEKRFGTEHAAVAEPLRNLGLIYASLGDYPRAIETYERALRISQAQGSDHRETALIHFYLSHTLLDVGLAEPSRDQFDRGVAICSELVGAGRVLGIAHMERAGRLLRWGDLEGARIHAEAALPLLSAGIGEDSVEFATALGVLGAVRARREDPAPGIERLETAIAVLDGVAGYRGPESWKLRAEVAAAYLRAGRRQAAIDSALHAERLARDHFRESTAVFSEREALAYRSQLVSGADVALSAFGQPKRDETRDAAGAVFDEVIRSRALVLDEMASRHPAHYGATSPELAELTDRLALAREELGRVAVESSPAGDADGSQAKLPAAWQAVETAERDLAQASRPFRERLERFSVGLAEVAAELPPDSALVAYKRYRVIPQGESDRRTEDGYLAFILRAGESTPDVVVLGAAPGIDERIARWRSEAGQAPPVATRAAAQAERQYREAGATLRAAVWDPVAARVGGSDLLLVVPDSGLNLVNFGALPSREDGYLVEQRTFHYLAAERDLVVATQRGGRGHGLIALGDPDFDVELRPTAQAAYRGTRSACDKLRGRKFVRLPAARAEVAEIAELWTDRLDESNGDADRAVVLVGDKATESAVKSLAPGRSVVHLATHGFVSPRGCASLLSPAAGKLAEMRSLENPLLHSGLVFAGANRRERTTIPADAEDGMLTAQEVASLDLSAVEWVVLSACETGVGTFLTGEGVLGLRRAFQIAGSETVIMSLWEINDEATRHWMREAYSERFAGRSTAQAVRSGTLSILEGRREAGLTTHPFYWGAFVAAGDWR